MGAMLVDEIAARPVGRTEAPRGADARPGSWPQDPREFESMVETYLDALVRYAFRRLGSRQDAEDAVQDVMVRAYVTRAEHRNVVQVGPYLYRMTSNACTDVLRQRQRRRSWHSILEYFGIASPRTPATPSDAANVAEESVRTERLLSRLPKAQAEVVRLRVFAELSLLEIAAVVGCSENTANSRLRYGFKRLRHIVSKESKP